MSAAAGPVRRTVALTTFMVVMALVAGCGSARSHEGHATPTSRPPGSARSTVPDTASTSSAPSAPTSAPTTAPPPGPAPAPTTIACAEGSAPQLTTRQKVGQVVMAELTYAQLGQAVTLVRDLQVGGIVFLGTPGRDLAGGLAKVRAAAKGNIGPLLATDEEGGRVQRLSSLLGALPSARQMAATEQPAQVRQLAQRHAQAMRAVGIDMDLAPDIDVNSTPTDTGVIGDRSFGTDPKSVAAYGLAFQSGLADGGVLGTMKHFPGHGRASGDSHLGAVTTPPLDSLQRRDLLPFVDAVRAHVPVIMIGHLTVPDLTGGLPATLSPAAIKGLLRHDLGYDGLVLTDSLSMGAVTAADTDPLDVVERTIVAGADLAMLPGNIDVGRLVDRLEADAGTAKLPLADLDRAVGHVAAAKALVDDWPKGTCDANE